MKKPVVWIAILFAVVVLAAIAFSTFGAQPYRCRVCIAFNGRTDCRTASAKTRKEAERAAVTTACAQLASGVSESSRCDNTPPSSVEWLQ
jgi:hypothetical protein